jgi:hypothetical protein
MRAFLVGVLEGAGLRVVGDTPSVAASYEGGLAGRGAEVRRWLEEQATLAAAGGASTQAIRICL